MLPGFVFCASYARAHVYGSWFAVSAMKARTHFCVFNGVVFSVDGCFLVLVRLRAVWYVPICDALFISARLASLFSFLRISAVLMAEFHIIFASILYLKRLFYVSIIFLQVFYIHNWHFCAVYVVILLFLKLKIDHAGGLLRDLCDLVVGFTSTCLVASRFAPDHGVFATRRLPEPGLVRPSSSPTQGGP